ncbi:MAG: S8 family serine peptidase [Planctomycetia bacterium]|nr:S8 family serine peptidase [Planctomycetia bacterium]
MKFAFRFSFFLYFLFISCPIFAVNPPDLNSAWLQAMNVDKVKYTGSGVSVAIIDDSIYEDHPWYKNNILKDSTGQTLCRTQTYAGTFEYQNDGTRNRITSANFNDNRGAAPTSKLQFHGTQTTGCVYQTATDVGLIGIKSDIHTFAIPQNIRYAVENGVDVISNSYSTSPHGFVGIYSASANQESKLQECYLSESGTNYYFSEDFAKNINAIRVFNDAINAGTVLLYSAGNYRENRGTLFDTNSQDANKLPYQAAPQTITVTALNTTDADPSNWKYSSFSNYGACIFVTAPGDYITSSDYAYGGVGEGTEEYCSGTSYSCPLAAGCVALATEAAKSVGNTMTSRLAKHLMVMSSTKVNAGDENTGWAGHDARTAWITNAAGNSFSNSYGFGLVNAEKMADYATQYTVTEQSVLTVNIDNPAEYSSQETILYLSDKTQDTYSTNSFATAFPAQNSQLVGVQGNDISPSNISSSGILNATVRINSIDAPESGDIVSVGSGDLIYSKTFAIDEAAFHDINFQALEEVALTIALGGVLGKLQMVLTHTNPNGEATSSILAFAQEDTPMENYNIEWTFTSNAFWGESAAGTWNLDIYDMYKDVESTFTVGENVYMTFYMGEAVPLPEPSAWILMLCFSGWFFFILWKKRTVRNSSTKFPFCTALKAGIFREAKMQRK